MKNIISLSVWEKEYVKALEDKENDDFLYGLLSFFYASDKDMENFRLYKPKKSKLYIDSGVFSARKKGIILETKKLIEFYKNNQDVIDYVFGMDEGTEEEQFEKTSIMVNEGVSTIPIIQLKFTKLERILQYVDKGCTHLGIGLFNIGGPVNPNIYTPAFNEFWNFMVKNNLEYTIKVHALGVETFYILEKWPFYSCDSSNVVGNAIWGQIGYYDKKKLSVGFTHPRKSPINAVKKYRSFDIRDCIEEHQKNNGNPASEARHARFVYSMKVRFAFQKLITDIWTDRGVVWDD